MSHTCNPNPSPSRRQRQETENSLTSLRKRRNPAAKQNETIAKTQVPNYLSVCSVCVRVLLCMHVYVRPKHTLGSMRCLSGPKILAMYGGLNKNGPIRVLFWMLSSQLVELFGKEEEVWPCWKCASGGELGDFKSLHQAQCLFLCLLPVDWVIKLSVGAPVPWLSASHQGNGLPSETVSQAPGRYFLLWELLCSWCLFVAIE